MTEEKEVEQHSETESDNIPLLQQSGTSTTTTTSTEIITTAVHSLNLNNNPQPNITIKLPSQASRSGLSGKTVKPTNPGDRSRLNSPGDRSRLLRAMSSPTLRIPTIDRELYQRSLTLNSPGLSPSYINSGTSQVFVYIPQNQDPLTGADKG